MLKALFSYQKFNEFFFQFFQFLASKKVVFRNIWQTLRYMQAICFENQFDKCEEIFVTLMDRSLVFFRELVTLVDFVNAELVRKSRLQSVRTNNARVLEFQNKLKRDIQDQTKLYSLDAVIMAIYERKRSQELEYLTKQLFESVKNSLNDNSISRIFHRLVEIGITSDQYNQTLSQLASSTDDQRILNSLRKGQVYMHLHELDRTQIAPNGNERQQIVAGLLDSVVNKTNEDLILYMINSFDFVASDSSQKSTVAPTNSTNNKNSTEANESNLKLNKYSAKDLSDALQVLLFKQNMYQFDLLSNNLAYMLVYTSNYRQIHTRKTESSKTSILYEDEFKYEPLSDLVLNRLIKIEDIAYLIYRSNDLFEGLLNELNDDSITKLEQNLFEQTKKAIRDSNSVQELIANLNPILREHGNKPYASDDLREGVQLLRGYLKDIENQARYYLKNVVSPKDYAMVLIWAMDAEDHLLYLGVSKSVIAQYKEIKSHIVKSTVSLNSVNQLTKSYRDALNNLRGLDVDYLVFRGLTNTMEQIISKLGTTAKTVRYEQYSGQELMIDPLDKILASFINDIVYITDHTLLGPSCSVHNSTIEVRQSTIRAILECGTVYELVAELQESVDYLRKLYVNISTYDLYIQDLQASINYLNLELNRNLVKQANVLSRLFNNSSEVDLVNKIFNLIKPQGLDELQCNVEDFIETLRNQKNSDQKCTSAYEPNYDYRLDSSVNMDKFNRIRKDFYKILERSTLKPIAYNHFDYLSKIYGSLSESVGPNNNTIWRL